jgi:hypothetical protein
MDVPLTEAQQQAVTGSPDVPARTIDPGTGQVIVLLKAEDLDWVRNLLGDESDASRRQDPRTLRSYAILSEDRYERFKAFFENDPLSSAERQALLREAGKRAGWDGPEWQGEEHERKDAS